MNKHPIFSWDKELGFASCILTDGENTYYGHAQCAPADLDFLSEKTGCEIAFRRACISMYKHYRDINKIKLATLKQYFYSINQSTQFDISSYEVKMLNRQMRMIETDLATAKTLLTNEKQNLNDYMKAKAEFYAKVRNNRQQDKNQQ